MISDRACGKGHILFGVNIVIAVFYGRYFEIPVTSRDERILVYLASCRSAGTLVGLFLHLGVIDFHVRRERDLRRFQKGDIALTLDSDNEGCSIMCLEGILAQGG